MPYATRDRQEFIKRSNLRPEIRILEIGGVLSEELNTAVMGVTSKKHINNAILLRPQLLPFKNSVFEAVVSYHYFDLFSSDKLDFIFEEAARVLHNDSSFSFVILWWTPLNEAQKSNLFFNDILKKIGAIFQHDFEEISNKLSASGFREIVIEGINREIYLPPDFVKEHLRMVGELFRIEKGKGRIDLSAIAKQYYHQVKEHGEAMLPAIHFTARK